MKLNIFSRKKKKDKGASIKATDFLNPRDGNQDDLDSENKSKKQKENSKKDTKVTKKELKRAKKKKKAEAKRAKKEAEKKAKAKAKEEKEEAKEREKEDKLKKTKNNQNKKKDKKAKKEAKEESDKQAKIENAQTAKANAESEKKSKKENKEEKKEINKEKEISQNNKTAGHEFEKSNILEINLVKDEINVYFDWYKNIAMLVVFVFLSFILVGEIYLALSWWQSENDSAVSQEEQRFIELSEETRKIRGEAEEALTFQTKLNRANFVLDNHLYWSNFFDYLERNTLENIQYASFEGDILGNFSIPAKSDSFPSLGQQVYQLQSDPNTIKVSIDSAEKLESEEENLEEIEFEINLKVKPDLFKK